MRPIDYLDADELKGVCLVGEGRRNVQEGNHAINARDQVI
jgi:hypothetical protein